MVATSQTVATRAGLAVLANGGSAVDAALAANAMLGVAEPHMCGPGGDLFALVWDPRAGALAGLNASGRSPAGLTLAALRDALGGRATMPVRGAWSVTAPGAVDGWCALHARYGRLPLAEVMAPAAGAAREGVPIGLRTAAWWQRAALDIARDADAANVGAAFAATFLRDGVAPAAGDYWRNPGLATTYERIAAGGRDAFYADEIGQAMARSVAASGSLTASDLAVAHAEWVAPLGTRYRDHDVYTLPPNGQGACVLQMLNLLEGYPIREFGCASADWWHLFVEAKKLAFADRARYYADPAHVRVPLDELLDKEYAARRRSSIRMNQASTQVAPGKLPVPGGDTTYVTTADRDGMMVSLIQSIFSPFGSAIVVPGFGFALQSRGAGFALDPAHPNCYAPGKRPFHTIIPGFVLRAGQPWFSLGVVGADMQPQGQVQILVNSIDFGLDAQAAADAPRVRHAGGAHPNGQEEDALGVVHYEPMLPPPVVVELARRGHRLAPVTDPIAAFVGGYQGIQRDERGVYCGGSESRFDGCALGL